MTVYTPPTVPTATPRVRPDSSRLQVRLYRYFRPLDLQVVTWGCSDGSVRTNYPVPVTGGVSNTALPYPWDPANTTLVADGHALGADGGIWAAQPLQGYAEVYNNIGGSSRTNPNAVQQFYLNPSNIWVIYGSAPRTVSGIVLSMLQANGFAAYLT